MVTNFDYEYAKALKQYEDAKTLQDKIKALELMQSTAPSHKGAENLRADIASKLSKMKSKLDSQKQLKGAGKSLKFSKEGASTIILIGLPNSGKSTLLAKLTNANPKISEYEFTTQVPELGVMDYLGAKIQVVELPAIVKDSYKGKARGKEILSLIRNGDLIAIVFYGDKEVMQYSLDLILDELKKSGIIINKKKPELNVKKMSQQGIEIVNEKNILDGKDKLLELLNKENISHVLIRVEEKSYSHDIVEAMDITKSYKKVIGIWVDGKDTQYKGINIYAYDNKLKEKLYKDLELIIVYTRKPGEKNLDNVPVALKKKSNIKDLCNILHKDFINNFKYAKVWGSTKYDGQQVSQDYILKDKDIVEIYAK
jgi:hypothetical protein